MYRYYEFVNFPDLSVGGDLVVGPEPLLGDSDRARTTVRHLGLSDNREFEKFFVQHETPCNLTWREGNQIRRGPLLEIIEFHIYRLKEEYGGYFLVEATPTVVREMSRRLRFRVAAFGVRRREVDLPAARATLEQATVKGGYFGQLAIEKVNNAAIFGPDVSESDMWEELNQRGALNALVINFTYLGEIRTALVTRNGGVMPLGTFAEVASLEMAKAVTDLFAPHSDLIEETIRGGSKR